MAIYKVSDLYGHIHKLVNEGYEYVRIDVIPADNQYPESISFEAIEETHIGVDLECIEATDLPDNYAR